MFGRFALRRFKPSFTFGLTPLVSFRRKSTLGRTSQTDNGYSNPLSTIDFTLKIFQNLHCRDLSAVMTDTFADFRLSREQSLSILNCDLFDSLNKEIMLALLQNKDIIVNNVTPEELWQSLKKWCQSQSQSQSEQNVQSKGHFNVNINNEEKWVESMKLFLAYIEFDKMDAQYFMDNIELIDDRYNIIDKDRKYLIMKQHLLNLISQKNENSVSCQSDDGAAAVYASAAGYKRLDRIDGIDRTDAIESINSANAIGNDEGEDKDGGAGGEDEEHDSNDSNDLNVMFEHRESHRELIETLSLPLKMIINALAEARQINKMNEKGVFLNNEELNMINNQFGEYYKEYVCVDLFTKEKLEFEENKRAHNILIKKERNELEESTKLLNKMKENHQRQEKEFETEKYIFHKDEQEFKHKQARLDALERSLDLREKQLIEKEENIKSSKDEFKIQQWAMHKEKKDIDELKKNLQLTESKLKEMIEKYQEKEKENENDVVNVEEMEKEVEQEKVDNYKQKYNFQHWWPQ